jgi:hypothetical protein
VAATFSRERSIVLFATLRSERPSAWLGAAAMNDNDRSSDADGQRVPHFPVRTNPIPCSLFYYLGNSIPNSLISFAYEGAIHAIDLGLAVFPCSFP